jgi:hypothetical protein
MLQRIILGCVLLVLNSCSNSDKILDIKDEVVILNVKTDNVHYTRALVLQFIQKNNLNIISDNKHILEDRYRLMEIQCSISEKLMADFLIKTELLAQVPHQKWETPLNRLILKIHYIK